MNEYILNIIGNFGYFGMFLAMILEAVIIIIPSELILATGGILAANHTFSLVGAILVGLLGSVFCAAIIYAMGYYGGRPFIQKYGKYFFMKEKDIEKSDKWFKKFGLRAALLGRLFPIVRTFISLPIGIARLDFKKFLLYTTLGSIPWTLLFVLSGFYLGTNYTKVSEIIDMFKLPIILILSFLLVMYIYFRVIKYKVIVFKIRKEKND